MIFDAKEAYIIKESLYCLGFPGSFFIKLP